jgi:hypothetical protein
MFKFKQGDVVVLLKDYPNYKLRKGTTGTVDESNSFLPYVIWDTVGELFGKPAFRLVVKESNLDFANPISKALANL